MRRAIGRTVQLARELHRDEVGAVMTEQITVLVLVAIKAAIAAGAVGIAVVRHYELADFLIGLPVP